MKRLALVLAAAVLGTGCHSSSTYTPPPPVTGSVDFSWSFVRVKADSNTAPPYGCTLAGIDNVVVSFPSGDVTVPCADAAGDGATIDLVAPGTQNVVITGRRGGVALYSSTISITVVAAQLTSAPVQVYGIPDDLDIYAHFLNQLGTAEWSTCAAANVATLSYSIVDWANTVVASGSISCADPAGLSFAGAAALDRDNYVIRMQGFEPSASTEAFDSATTAVSPTCSGQAFNHYGADVGNAAWDVYLYDVTSNVTFCP